LGGLDALVFTGGIGENDPLMRGMICSNMGFLGLKIDEDANRATVGRTGVISSEQSKVKVLVIPTDEELAIAEETRKKLIKPFKT
ncbi:MAG: acetate kinase, partial [Thermoproteota archaeon]